MIGVMQPSSKRERPGVLPLLGRLGALPFIWVTIALVMAVIGLLPDARLPGQGGRGTRPVPHQLASSLS